MRGILFTTASTLKAILCYIDAEKTPKIAYDKDEYAIPLANKIKKALDDRDGSESVSISFNNAETELRRQFVGVCDNIANIFKDINFHYNFYEKIV
jgi:hypothetical protein